MNIPNNCTDHFSHLDYMLDSDLCETMGNATHFSSHFTLLPHPPTSCRETWTCPELMHGIQSNKNGGGDKKKRENSTLNQNEMKRSNQTERHTETPHPQTLWAWHYLREMAHIWGIHRGMIEKRGWGRGKDENKYKTDTHTLTWRPSGPFLQYQVQSRRWLQKTGQGTMPQLHRLHLDKYHLGVRGRKVSPPTDSKNQQ